MDRGERTKRYRSNASVHHEAASCGKRRPLKKEHHPSGQRTKPAIVYENRTQIARNTEKRNAPACLRRRRRPYKHVRVHPPTPSTITYYYYYTHARATDRPPTRNYCTYTRAPADTRRRFIFRFFVRLSSATNTRAVSTETSLRRPVDRHVPNFRKNKRYTCVLVVATNSCTRREYVPVRARGIGGRCARSVKFTKRQNRRILPFVRDDDNK